MNRAIQYDCTSNGGVLTQMIRPIVIVQTGSGMV